MAIHLGLDLGTTAVKALAIDDQGRVLAEASREYTYATPHPGWVEQDAEDWWRLTVECVREAVERVGRDILDRPVASRDLAGPGCPGPRVRALAISTQGDTVVPLDDAGAPLAPAITWMDSRTLPEVARMDTEADLWFRITGSPPAPFAAAASLLWWRDERPEVFRRARRFALVADFIIGRLAGRPMLDAPNASRTMLYDIRQRQWSPELLGRVGVSDERLAETAESGTVVGPLLPDVAAELGLSPDTQVVLGGHDQTCAAVGCGVIRPGSLMLSCGTAWVVLAATEGPLFDDTHSLQGYCHAVPGGYAVIGAYAGGNLLKWFRDTLWCESGTAGRLIAGPSNGNNAADPYDLITAEAQAAREAGRPALTFLSHFYGTFGPIRCQAARGAWAGLTLQHTRGDLALSLLDGVALQTAWTVQNLARQGAASDDIRMIGGGARSRFWAQLVANATGLPIRLPEVREAAAYGAALIAATASGAFSSLDEATSALTIREVIEPDAPPDPAALDRHKELLQALVPIWEELGRL
jgi:xylulokinase